MPDMKFTVAVVQCENKRHCPAENLRKAEQYIAQAADAGADLVVFPEAFVLGTGARAREMADADGRYRDYFASLADRYGVDLVPGSITERGSDRFYNVSYYMDRSGAVLARYAKVNLWRTEKPWCTPGTETVVCETRFGRVGLTVCWDLAFPEVFRDMLAERVDIVVCSALWSEEDAGSGQVLNPKAEAVFVDSMCVARAFENEIAVIFCNYAGTCVTDTGGTLHSIGCSQVAVPFIGRLARAEHAGETVLVREIDTAVLRTAEAAYEIRKDCLA